jgi:hypothetical protein
MGLGRFLCPGVLLALAVTFSAFGQKRGLQPTSSQLQLAFSPQEVAVTGATPSGAVAWLVVARVPELYVSAVVRREGTAVADAGGSVTLAPFSEVPLRSIWVVVDISSGAVGVATPPGFPLRSQQLRLRPLASADPGRAGKFSIPAHLAVVLVARPKVGAWLATLWDGLPGDEDGPGNGNLYQKASSLAAIDTSMPPLEFLLPDDVVVVVDPEEMAVAAGLVAGAKG